MDKASGIQPLRSRLESERRHQTILLVEPNAEAISLNPIQCRCHPGHEHQRRRSPTSRGTKLKPWPVWVRLPPSAPFRGARTGQACRSGLLNRLTHFAVVAQAHHAPPISACGVKQHSAAYNRGRTRSVPGAGASPAAPTICTCRL